MLQSSIIGVPLQMSEQISRRRLAAVLAADVAGYSRLMGADEEGTLAALKTRRQDILQPLVAKHHGRIVKVMGDGVLVEFASPLSAVQCAVDLQRAMADANRQLPEDRHILLRIGINLGDVMIEGSDLYGEGVNIAARLETLAEPGSVFVSGKVRQEVGEKLGLMFDHLGERTLKNIAVPIQVYRVSGAPAPAPSVPFAKAAESPKPSIAVLPFTNMSGDSDQEYFSDGVTEDIITELSRFRDLFVIARNSSFQYRGKDVDLRRVGQELGVAYVIEGSVRRSGDRLRITAQLIDARSGRHLWAERYDRNMQDMFALQEEIANSVVATVGNRVELAQIDRAMRADPGNLEAYDLILRAKWLVFQYTKHATAESRVLARRATEIDPGSAKAWSYLGYSHFMEHIAHWVPDPADALAQAYEFQKKAVALDENDIEVSWKFGQVLLAMRRFDEAYAHFARALAVNPNDTEARCQWAVYLDCMGHHQEALEHYDIAARRNPIDITGMPWLRGVCYFAARRYEDAVAELSKMMPDPIYEVHGWMAACYAEMGREADARSSLEMFLRGAEADMALFPGRRLRDLETYWRGTMFYRDERDYEHLFDALRKAGLPD
jgi:TolB-like protein/class 3 adenylate cyclase/Tfp pilus assembly protein PilF